MKRLAGCSCVLAAALKFLFAGGAIEVRPTASEAARKKPAATGKGRLGDAIRQLLVVALCTLSEVADTVPEVDA
jgi:hypothetical protein